ncbi:MAG: hypothetical protein Q6360_13210 [Candidatus Brocadiales bacterium]|nr:hypothetical protein [Candidatus Brocadiales bacterium]
MKILVSFNQLEKDTPVIPFVIDEDDITSTTDWKKFVEFGIKTLKSKSC